MIKLALFARLEAKPGKEASVADLLATGLACPLGGHHPNLVCAALVPTTFGVFDAFHDEAGRQAHLAEPIAQALVAKTLMPEADHFIPYHLLVEGTCYARLLDGEFVELSAGDLVMFPAGDRHVLATASDASLRLAPTEITGESLSYLKRNEIVPFKSGDKGSATRIVCGYLACDKRLAEPILLSLPRLLKVSMRDGSAAAWVQSSIRFSVAQSVPAAGLRDDPRPPVRGAVRRSDPPAHGHVAAGETRTGSPRCATATSGAPSRSSTNNRRIRGRSTRSRARSALSRSALGQRFAALIGRPPMEYLMRWRILLAAQRLRESRAPIVDIAAGVGYESEAAFNRAFKRELVRRPRPGGGGP